MIKKLSSHFSNDSYIYQLRTVQESALISNFSVTNLSSFSFLRIPLWDNYSHCYEPKVHCFESPSKTTILILYNNKLYIHVSVKTDHHHDKKIYSCV